MSHVHTYHLTLRLLDTGQFQFLSGTPSEHGLTATAAHSFDLPGAGRTTIWTVDCELTGEQVRALAIIALRNL